MFSAEFEKIAISIGWAQKRMSRGIAKRTGDRLKDVHKASVKAYQQSPMIKAMLKAKGMTTHELMKTPISQIPGMRDVVSATNIAAKNVEKARKARGS